MLQKLPCARAMPQMAPSQKAEPYVPKPSLLSTPNRFTHQHFHYLVQALRSCSKVRAPLALC